MGLQKLLIFVMIVVEAVPNLIGGFMRPDATIAANLFGGNTGLLAFIIFLQL